MTFYSVARRALRPAGTLAAAFALSSCTNDILSVGTPDVLSADALGGTLGATTLRNGAMQDFVVAFSGTQDGYVVASGNMADEIETVDTFADRYFTNERNENELLGGALNTRYNNLHQARAGLATAIANWTTVKPTVRDSLSEMYSIRGYAEMLFAEGYCAGVPFSRVNPDGSFEHGDPLTTVQMLTVAGATFDSALTLSSAGSTYRNLASIGKARALLNAGQFAQAAAAVAGVPTTYRYQMFHSVATARQQNGIFNASFQSGSRYTVGTKEGVNGLDFLTTPADPRVPWTASARIGFDGFNRNLPVEQKYPAQGSAVTLADGIEARLIEAEARLRGATQADRDAVFATLNTLRATGLATPIAALPTAPTTQDAAVNLLFQERAFWMWLTGHRLGDMRRLIRQYGRTAATVFPTGPVRVRPGNNYGSDVNMIVPVAEKNNPKFKGCIDRNA